MNICFLSPLCTAWCTSESLGPTNLDRRSSPAPEYLLRTPSQTEGYIRGTRTGRVGVTAVRMFTVIIRIFFSRDDGKKKKKKIKAEEREDSVPKPRCDE